MGSVVRKVIGQQREGLGSHRERAVAIMAGVGKQRSNIEYQEVMEYAMEWGNEANYVVDELERIEEGEVGGDMDGWPQEGREHRWISVMAPTKWGVTERKELEEVMETYKTFSLVTGSRTKGEIWVRNKGWEGSMIDLREHNSVHANIVLTGWRMQTDTGVL